MSITFCGLLASMAAILAHCTTESDSDWERKNQEIIEQLNLPVRRLSGLPATLVQPNLDPAGVVHADSLVSITLAPGVQAKLFWGTGTMVSLLQLEPNATIPEEALPADGFVFVMEGSVEQSINGSSMTMVSRKREEPDGVHSGTPRTDFVYIEKGTKHAVTAGPAGAKLLEVYSPLRLDYLEKAGVANLPDKVEEFPSMLAPNVEANRVYDLFELQFTKLAEDAYARLVSGKNMQLSFVSLNPESEFPRHIHPEEQITFVLRGNSQALLLASEYKMNPGAVVRIPGNMVHGARIGDLGNDVLDIFWPSRADNLDKEKATLAAYHAIIPPDAKVELVIDGKKTKPELYFSEGPKWMDGKVYFSNMYFDQDFNADPKRSSIVELSPDGSYRNISAGKMQANGLYPYKNGNLVVCDMMGHRIVEMTTRGEVVNILVDQYEGKPIDGPNDIITDAKGGIYFTDPQFTMESEKFQPGRAVYYRSPGPDGKLKRIVEPNEFAMPNGILLSPDGRTLYINNCYDDETWYPVNSDKDNFIWAYDVNPDGTISHGRKFARLLLPEAVLDRKGKSSSADGMAIDKNGNIYVATYCGVQIFDTEGTFLGMISLPSFPVSLCFGDADMKTLYIVSYSKVYKIRTNVEGYVNYL